MSHFKCLLAGVTISLALQQPLLAEQAGTVSVDKQGVVTLRDLAVPPSSYASPESRAAMQAYLNKAPQPEWFDVDSPIKKLRALDEADMAPLVAAARRRYPVTIVKRRIAGVPVQEIRPKTGILGSRRDRVLINLHGGGFFVGAGGEALLESIPLASLGGYRVITVNYRQGPEHRFPAATDDVVAVYRALLRQYRPERVGIYGCSAGGSLAAMAAAKFQRERLPNPGAIAILSASAFAGFSAPPATPGAWGGDSRFTAPVLNGEPPQALDGTAMPFAAVASRYLQDVDLKSPLASPGEHPEILAKFPPTLVLAGTRGFDFSAAIETHRRLLRAGAQAELNVWDGMGHCFFTDPGLPESREAFEVLSKFFDRRLSN